LFQERIGSSTARDGGSQIELHEVIEVIRVRSLKATRVIDKYIDTTHEPSTLLNRFAALRIVLKVRFHCKAPTLEISVNQLLQQRQTTCYHTYRRAASIQ